MYEEEPCCTFSEDDLDWAQSHGFFRVEAQ